MELEGRSKNGVQKCEEDEIKGFAHGELCAEVPALMFKDLQYLSALILLRHGLWSSVSRSFFFALVCDEWGAG